MKKAKTLKKVYKVFHILASFAIVFNMSLMGVFFVAQEEVKAQVLPDESLCDADVDVVMVMDRSGSMRLREAPGEPSKMEAAKDAAGYFLDFLGTSDQSALVSFADTVFIPAPDKALSSDHSSTQASINALVATGNTNIGDAINEANNELLSVRANDQAVKVMILLTDGKANRPESEPDPEAYAEAKAQEAADAGIKIFTIGLGSDVNATSLQAMADVTGGQYYYAPDTGDLEGIYNQISQKLCDYGSISGCKYVDADKDYSVSGDNRFLIGWEILLGGDGDDSMLTDRTGCYTFTGLEPGTYTVTEGTSLAAPVFEQTYPLAPDFYTIDINWEDSVTEVDFGNYFPMCGNDILDSDYGEICEIGDTDECVAGDYNGTKACVDCDWGSCVPDESCGDGEINGVEECDGDDMGIYDDGHYICDVCTAVYQPYCGDDEVDEPNSDDFYEECDGDAPKECDADGYLGSQECSACEWTECETDKYCGDDDINGDEICDDGDDNGTFGFCNSDCTGDTPSVCGNGDLEEPEECDDNNTDDGDGCSASCILESTPGSIKIIKDAGDSDETFNFYGDWEFSLMNLASTTYEDLDSGLYTIYENNLADNWFLGEVDCGSASTAPAEEGAGGIIIDLSDGEDVVCTFYNTYRTPPPAGSIGGCKYNDVGNDGSIVGDDTLEGWEIELWSYTWAPPEGVIARVVKTGPSYVLVEPGAPFLFATTTTNESGCYSFDDLNAGWFSVNEILQDAWTQTFSTATTTFWFEPEGEAAAYDFANYREPYCGDDICNGEESCEDCSADCGSCGSDTYCGDGSVQTPNDDGFHEECDGSAPSGYTCNSDCTLKQNSSSGGGTPTYDGGGAFYLSTGETEVLVLGEEGAPVLTIEKSTSKNVVNPGEEIEFEITVTNTGNLTAFNVVLTDVLPEGFKYIESEGLTKDWILGDMAAGESKVTTVKVSALNETEKGTYSSPASAEATNHDKVSDSVDVSVELVQVLAATGFSIIEFISLLFLSLTTIALSRVLRRKILA